jgi:hypothetical protein
MPELPQQRTARPPKPQYRDLFREPALPASSTERDDEDDPEVQDWGSSAYTAVYTPGPASRDD